MKFLSEVQYKILNWVMTNRFLKGASLVRILLGSIIVYIYILHYAQRHYLWGPQGIIPHEEYSSSFAMTFFSLYQYSDSILYFDIIFHIGLIIAILFTIGWGGRSINILNFIFVWSLMDRNYIILDGGDNILRIVLFYLLFANLNIYYSVDSSRKHKRNQKREALLSQHETHSETAPYANTISQKNQSLKSYTAILHNVAILACIVQLCLVYFVSGMYQVMGERWHSGTALYYIFQVQQYSIPWVTENIVRSDFLLVLGAYSSIFIKIAFPFMLFNRKMKYFGVMAILFFHIGIAAGMGLITFSLIMIALELLVFTDREYQSMGKIYLKLKQRIKNALLHLGYRIGQKPVLRTQILRVYYDGWCPMCMQTVNKLKRWDVLRLVSFMSFRDENVIKEAGIDIAQAEKRMVSIGMKNLKKYEGIESFIQLSIRVVPLMPLSPFLWMAHKVGIGQKVYDFIADKREVIPVNQCRDQKQCEVIVKK